MKARSVVLAVSGFALLVGGPNAAAADPAPAAADSLAGPVGKPELLTRDHRGKGVTPGSAQMADVSADGRYVTFESTHRLTRGAARFPGDHIFVRDRVQKTTKMVDTSSTGAPAKDDSFSPKITADGRYVVFSSKARNLVPGDSGEGHDVFVRDLVAGMTMLVSQSASGGFPNDGSITPAISADGRFIAFTSRATDIVPGVTGLQVYLRDMVTGDTILASATGASEPANGENFATAISEDGRYVVLESNATNLTLDETDNRVDVFRRDLVADVTVKVSQPPGGGASLEHSYGDDMTADGDLVAFTSEATNLAGDDVNERDDVFLYDFATGALILLARGADGQSIKGLSVDASMSSDGRYIAYSTSRARLHLPQGGAHGFCSHHNVVVRDLVTGEAILGSKFADGSCAYPIAVHPTISDFGYVAYSSTADLAADDPGHTTWDIYGTRVF